MHWKVRRDRRSFSVRVVEPRLYAPATHGNIFEQVLSELISPTANLVEDVGDRGIFSPTQFDLLTFPEAFAPVDALLVVLNVIDKVESIGCVHVGLRPDKNESRHLFLVSELDKLVSQLRQIPNIVGTDLDNFASWLNGQRSCDKFNVGCLFTLDAESQIRVCLHPKLVRSQYEHSALQERHLDEADLVTIITLIPSDNRFLSVTIQPLVCSDALNLATDRGTPAPIRAINSADNPFPDPPDHIDLVSIATCSPQVESYPGGQAATVKEWHQDFRDTFCRAAMDGEHVRHHFATFIMSNFETIQDKSGGLSGLFQPIAPKETKFHNDVHLSCFGQKRSEKGNNKWWPPDVATSDGWDWRGYIAALNPSLSGDTAAVRVFGFSLTTLLRDTSLWKPSRGPAKCEVLLGRWDNDQQLEFHRAKDGTGV